MSESTTAKRGIPNIQGVVQQIPGATKLTFCGDTNLDRLVRPTFYETVNLVAAKKSRTSILRHADEST